MLRLIFKRPVNGKQAALCLPTFRAASTLSQFFLGDLSSRGLGIVRKEPIKSFIIVRMPKAEIVGSSSWQNRKSPSIDVSVRAFHSSSLLCRGGRHQPGQGGESEEKHIAQAIRQIQESSPPTVVIEILNACHAQVGLRYLTIRRQLKTLQEKLDNPLWIRVLTHADLLGKTALKYQVHRAGRNGIPVIAVSLKDATKSKVKQIRPIMQLLAAANEQRIPGKAQLVCGLPNAGKSSFIHALTRHRTVAVKKKKEYHLPKINPIAGWTLGSKKHAFELVWGVSVSLTDTPGLRPRLEWMEPSDMAYLIATGSMTAKKQMLTPDLKQQVVQILEAGLIRHAKLEGLDEERALFDNLEAFRATANGAIPLATLIRDVGLGKYGGIVIEQDEYFPDPKSSMKITPNPPFVLGMNAAALELYKEGERMFPAKLIQQSE